ARPTPDPWLNRKMRQDAGLLLPERRIGLSAHDFQQAVAAREVWLTRAVRDAEAETVPSRWVNRLTNLLGGLDGQGGAGALAAMRARGARWLKLAELIEAPKETVSPESRPSPRPPVDQRPNRLSVTRINTLIRDPYAIYAQYVLKLRPLDPIRQAPDAPVRGTVLHKILERFVLERGETEADLMRIADAVLATDAPWPAARRVWRAKLARVAGWFIEGEARRRALGTPQTPEMHGRLALNGLAFTLTAKADRFDRAADGSVYLFDYKTGKPPSESEQLHFEKQLLLEAAMTERGAFSALGKTRVRGASYIGLGASPVEVPAPIGVPGLDVVWDNLHDLIRAYFNPDQGYSSRRAVSRARFAGDYDHLARFGEWDDSDAATPVDVS
ncbi:MAG: PD-(D/E)XK nuclease family protein, partial [Halocynthiibacter sp.]